MRRRHPAGVFVEVVGLPGAGKTTAVRAARSALPGLGEPDWDDESLASGPVPVPLRLFLRAPLLSALSYATVLAVSPSDRVRLRRMWSVQRRYIISRRCARPALVDEGFLHVLYVTLYGAHFNPVARRLLRATVRVGTRSTSDVVYLAVSKAEAVRRFQDPARGSVRFNSSTTQESIQHFLRDDTYDELLAAVTKGRSSTALLFIAPDDLTEELRRLI